MAKTIFYSWQSDLPNPSNRSLIRTALEKACKELHREEIVTECPRVDSDTQDVPGSPDIVSTIFEKINKCDVFVADITIVNHGNGRPTPNPNVLIELGYALSVLGQQKVLMVCNTAYGAIKDLPFDINSKRVLAYHLLETAGKDEVDSSAIDGQEQRKKYVQEARDELKGKCKSQLKAIFGHTSVPEEPELSLPAVANTNNWEEQRNNAARLLSEDSRTLRIAGVHSLENVGRNSSSHHWQIVELLMVTLRDWTANLSNKSHITSDIQAIITALGRRKREWDCSDIDANSPQGRERVLNFSHMSLRGANFTHLHLEKSTFISTILQDCVFDGCHLEESCFQHAQINNCSFGHFYQNSAPALCQKADFMNAQFNSAHLVGTNFTEANLRGARFGDVNSKSLNAPYDVVVCGADFTNATLSGTVFVRGMELRDVNFHSANMKQCFLYGVDLSLALNIEQQQKSDAFSDQNTRWP